MDIQDIKKRIYIDEHGISNYSDVAIDEMDWLVAQAEKADRYEEALKQIVNFYDDYKYFPTYEVTRITAKRALKG